MRKLQSQAPYQRARLKKERADHKKRGPDVYQTLFSLGINPFIFLKIHI